MCTEDAYVRSMYALVCIDACGFMCMCVHMYDFHRHIDSTHNGAAIQI